MEQSTCRLCLRKSEELLLLSDYFAEKSSNRRIGFLEALNCCTQLKARFEDELPQVLCTFCGTDLQLCYEFVNKAKLADAQFRRQLLGKGRQTRSKVKWAQNSEIESNGDDEDGAAETESYLGTNLGETFDAEEVPLCSNKDPLEDSDDDEEDEEKPDNDSNERDMKVNWNWNEGDDDKNMASSTSDDEEDNKPLKELFYEVTQSKMVNNQLEKETAAATNQASVSECFSHFTQGEDEADDYEFNLSNIPARNLPDLALSAEAQIFPQGRFKCKTCNKTYFTTVGLQAHLEVHLPKSATTKKKRVRGPNKKKRKTKSNPTQQHQDDLEVNQIIAFDEEQKTENRAVENNADQTIAKAERKPRKQKLPKPKKMFPCHVCGKHMISASKLRYHMVMHTGEKDYLCTMCPKAYSTIYALKHHMRTHTGERPYECKFCGDRFTRPTTLKSHMRRHTGERPYGCEICGKRFIQHSSMTTHMKLNHMAKTIKCSHCDKKYARQTDLNTHLLSHTGDKPFSCQLCPSRFIRQANLNKHMNQHHSPGCVGGAGQTTNKAKTSKKKQNNSKTAAAAAVQESILSTQATVEDINPALHSCKREVSLSNSSKLTQLSENNQAQQQLDEVATTILTAAKFQLNSNPMMPSLVVDTDNHDLLSNLPLSQQPQTVDANIPQHLFADSTRLERSIEDLNRWNWPNHS